ncbi:MAG: hypothetical protein IPM64_10420 [Phycisphaerales bacterium]|nr:hypothetical protein [Phycisphaerales bacterium]
MILFTLLLLFQAADPEALMRKAAEIPAADRVARFVALSGGNPADAAWDEYAAATEAIVTWFNMAVSQDAESSALADAIETNMGRMLLTDTWTHSQQFMIQRYLELNADALARIRKATARPTFGLKTDLAAPLSTVNLSEAIRPFTAGRLALLKAADEAQRGNWKEAWEWNRRAARCTAHLSQVASVLAWGAARANEARQRGQAFAFLHRAPQHAPADPLWQKAVDAQRAASDDATCEAEVLYSLDLTERLAAWAAGKAEDAELDSLVEIAVTGIPDAGGALGESSAKFKDVADFRRAMRKWSVAKQLDVEIELTRLLRAAAEQPFHELIREVREKGDDAPLRRRYREISERSPANRLMSNVVNLPPEHSLRRSRYAMTTAEAMRAVVAILAAQKKGGGLPATLEAAMADARPAEAAERRGSAPAGARPAALPMDAFSGQPLIYRRTGADTFTLYSVGYDGDDDGGKAVRPEEDQDGDFVFWPPQIPEWIES